MSLNGDARPQPSRIVLITGANRGPGRETACQPARLGVHVVIGSRGREAGQAGEPLGNAAEN
jgi:NAD(P)-dependent dehydrogenase (short-subunit alcohol dehydrogenase family)